MHETAYTETIEFLVALGMEADDPDDAASLRAIVEHLAKEEAAADLTAATLDEAEA